MLSLEFPGCSKLVDALDHAVCHDCPNEITNDLRSALCKLIRDPDVKLPECCYRNVPDHYARRELYRSDAHGFCVIAMTWGPGQGTPIHDHAGMWCVEGVWRGDLEITPYELTDQHDDRYRFESRGIMNVGPGSAGSLIPPHEYHTIRNPSTDDIAVTLHVYRGPMTQCSVFQPLADNWYTRDKRKLYLDATH